VERRALPLSADSLTSTHRYSFCGYALDASALVCYLTFSHALPACAFAKVKNPGSVMGRSIFNRSSSFGWKTGHANCDETCSINAMDSRAFASKIAEIPVFLDSGARRNFFWRLTAF